MPTEIEPYTIEFLAEAIKALQNAKQSTKLGNVKDRCGLAISQIRQAIMVACGAEDD